MREHSSLLRLTDYQVGARTGVELQVHEDGAWARVDEWKRVDGVDQRREDQPEEKWEKWHSV